MNTDTQLAPCCTSTFLDEQDQPMAFAIANDRGYVRWKGFFDRSLAAILLVISSPIIAIAVLIVRCTSRGPAIFHQRRVGRKGRLFTMHKIRTMVQDAETRSGPVWAVPSDPRMTRVGRVLRKLHLDELPQLWNVLKGEMSLVGPRPERPEFTHRLAADIPQYLDRLAVLPGITGLAQINLPPDTDLDSVRRKLVLDLQYIEKCGPLLDLKLLACTTCRAVGLPGHFVARLIGVRRKVQLDSHPKISPTLIAQVHADEAREFQPRRRILEDAPVHLPR
jgi:lipopolysaccharide/colanic/teichoic acid biosynthesis glycosyltransferase